MHASKLSVDDKFCSLESWKCMPRYTASPYESATQKKRKSWIWLVVCAIKNLFPTRALGNYVTKSCNLQNQAFLEASQHIVNTSVRVLVRRTRFSSAPLHQTFASIDRIDMFFDRKETMSCHWSSSAMNLACCLLYSS